MELEPSKLLNKEKIREFVDQVRKLTFPHLYKCKHQTSDQRKAERLFKKYISPIESHRVTFFSNIEFLRNAIFQDLEFTFQSDPACNGYEEIVGTYPGFAATFHHRIAHILYNLGLKIAARIVSEEAHFLTGIDIHPGAEIASPFFIDHGTGIVIGETAQVGHHVKIYQGVTLGALSLSRGQQLKDKKRHPTIGNYVTIYSGASILGGEVVIGDNVVIGSNVFLLDSIPDYHRVTITKPELVVIKKEPKT